MLNRPKATRLGLTCIAALVACVAAFGGSFASGDVSSTATAWYGPSGATTLSPVPGSSGDYEIDQSFTYSDVDEDLKKWIVDAPAGLFGNPNAVASSDRCTTAQFDPSGTFGGPSEAVSQAYPTACPSTSIVGYAKLYTESDGKDGTGATAAIPAGTPLTTAQGVIYLLKTDPEIPVTLATVLQIPIYQTPVCNSLGQPTAPCVAYRRTTSILAPETNQSPNNNGDTDFRIRTIPHEFVSKPVAFGPTGLGFPSYAVGGLKTHISRIDQHLYSHANQDSSNPPFLSYPVRLGAWDSYSYSTAYNTNTAATLVMDPNNTSDLYKKSAADTVTPEQTAPPLKSTFTGTLSNPVRGANTAFTGTVGDPTPIGDDQPQKLVMTLPEAVSIDVDALGTVCTLVQRQNADCPDASQVGTATISTPLISAGLTGKVYMTTSSNKSLPNLSIFATGAIKFRLDATTRFVGPNSNQIETTLDNLPQNVFTNFTVTISGGNNSLLLNRSCPTDGSAPAYGGTTSTLSGYAGNTTSATSNNTFDGCYGVNKPSKLSHCVKQSKKLKVSPKGLIDTGNIAKIDLLTGTKSTNQHTRSTVKKSPFKFNLTLKKSKYKKNKKYYYAYKVTYKPTSDAPSGKTIKTGSGTFKTCK